MTVGRLVRWGLAAAVLVAVALAAVVAARLSGGKTGGPVQSVKASAEVVARGKYLTEASDCAACHSAPGGAPFAGGLPMASGFGTIYATNITPDPDDGIGRWSADDFWAALHDGARRDGQPLYPAMPYTSYRGMTRADSDAIYAYLMQLKPMQVTNLKTELAFPYNIRLGMMGWNLLFLNDALPATSTGSSGAWQRGRYLVNVLGHCGECHTPRGIVGQMEQSRALTGFALGRVAAPDITPAGLAARGWIGSALRTYLGRGIAGQGSAFADMHPVVMLSTRNLTAEDLAAMTTYLLGDNPPPPVPLQDVYPGPVNSVGRDTYVALCAGCHGLEGRGVPNTVVGLIGNSTLRQVDPRNLIVATLDGISAANFPHRASFQAMPGFADKLGDEQAAALANYMRVMWGGQRPDVTAAAVKALR